MEEDRDSIGTSRGLDKENNELVSNASQQRNWRGIVIALLVIIIVCALIVTAVIIATPEEDPDNMGEKFTLEDFENPEYKPRSFSASWLPDQNFFLYKNDYDEIKLYNCSGNFSKLLVDNSTFSGMEPEVTQLSADGRYLLIKYNVQKVFRHSRLADYATYELETKNLEPLKPPEPVLVVSVPAIQYVAWAPVGNALVIVQNNNVHYKKSVADDSPATLTKNGYLNGIYNGIPDWVYEEEVLSSDNAIWWSKGASYLIYATFNDSHVPIFTFPTYGGLDKPYTTPTHIAYPKPGYPNPTFTLNIVDLETKSKATLSPPPDFTNTDYLFTSVVWRNDEEVLITWKNRIQNRAIITLCQANGGSCRKSQDIKSKTGWLELFNPALFMPDGSHYFMALPHKEGHFGTYKHVAMIEIRNGTLNDRKVFLTQGKWEVSKIEGYDAENRTLYFTSAMKDAKTMHLYSVSVDTRDVKCETCDYDEKMCEYNTVSMASTAQYYILQCQGPGIPKYALMTRDGMEVDRLENNTEFSAKMALKSGPQVVYEQVVLKDGEKLWAKLLLPPQLKTEEIIKYPLFLFVYGGPGSQQVEMKYSTDWQTYLVTSRDIIYAYVDGRGTKGRGDKFMHSIYRNLGSLEVDDTIEAAEYFAGLNYVDENKMAVWGWSYGGYLTASILGRKKHPFKCGISVAPVTDWTYYDSVYTERYMRLPTTKDNIIGYQKANVSQYAYNFKDASFMLVHGTGDDNVHFQQAAQLVKALTEANVYFRFQFYTDKDHGLIGGNTRRHLYESMEDFLVECYDGYSEKFGNSHNDEESVS